MRKQYINNLRWFTVLLLVPYHAACVYRTPARDFFVNSPRGGLRFYDNVVFALATWMMPMLFALAGASAYYALSKRTAGQFVKERVFRLLIPLAICTILLSPVQMYFGNLSHFVLTEAGGIWPSIKMFFGSKTFGGYAGGFSYTGFWFVRHLFYMSILTLPLLVWYRHKGDSLRASVSKMNLAFVMLLFVLPAEGYMVKPNDYSFLEYGAVFLLGFFVLTNDEVVERLKKHWWWLMILAVLFGTQVVYCRGYRHWDTTIPYMLCYRFVRWESVLAIFALFARFFDRRSRVTDYLTGSSYGFYLLHQTLLVTIAWYVNKHLARKLSIHGLYWVVVGITFVCAFAGWEILHRIPGVRLMLGYKKKAKA